MKYRRWLYWPFPGLLIYVFAPWLASRWNDENLRHVAGRMAVAEAELFAAIEELKMRREMAEEEAE